MIPFNPLLIKKFTDTFKEAEPKKVSNSMFKSTYTSDDSTGKGIIMFIGCMLFLGLIAYLMSLKY